MGGNYQEKLELCSAFGQGHLVLKHWCVTLKLLEEEATRQIRSQFIRTYTLLGAGSRAILALVIIPNCPKPPRTA